MPDLRIPADTSHSGPFEATAKASGSIFATPEPTNRVPPPAGSAARIVEPAGPFSTVIVERTSRDSAEHGTCALCWIGPGPLQFLVFARLTLPITPADRLHAAGLDASNELFADSVGWSDIASQVLAIHSNLPDTQRSSTVIISAYYGIPGALQIYSEPNNRPVAVSPELSDYYWLPPDLTATNALMIDYQPAEVAWMCTDPTLIAHLTVPYEVSGLEQRAPVTFCHLRAPLQTLWPRLRNFS
jgi:hypothetical protein